MNFQEVVYKEIHRITSMRTVSINKVDLVGRILVTLKDVRGRQVMADEAVLADKGDENVFIVSEIHRDVEISVHETPRNAFREGEGRGQEKRDGISNVVQDGIHAVLAEVGVVDGIGRNI